MFGYIITIFASIFWIFRLMVTLMYSAEVGFSIVPMNVTFEIVVLFITFVCIILVAKRKMIGAVIYLITQCAYFGVDAYKTLSLMMNGQEVNSITLVISILAIIIPLFAIMDIGLNSGKKGTFDNKETNWFYGTNDYERKFDDRADKNQYKF